MATTVRLWLHRPGPDAASAVAEARDVFARIERTCTRFDPDSDLMRANGAPTRPHRVPDVLDAVLREAHRAHRDTGGLFDPRVHDILTGLGYTAGRTFPEAVERDWGPGIAVPTRMRGPLGLPVAPRRALRRPWKPAWTPGGIVLGPQPVDLGGIGKGLAVRWASAALRGHAAAHLVEAGGDLHAAGTGPAGDGWRARVEYPAADGTLHPDPAAVLDVTDAACATSSVRLRSWRVGGRAAHHLIDPRTGEPADAGLRAVTVVHPDAAWAEVWSKSLFLVGRRDIRARAHRHGIAALWVDDDGYVGMSRGMRPRAIWRRTHDLA